MENKGIKFENALLLIIVLLSYMFLGYSYYVTTEATIRGVILTAIIGTLSLAVNWRFGSSKSSANKDGIIQTMKETPKVVAETVNTENVETVNTNTVNTK